VSYVAFIEKARLIDEVESCTTTGDGDYPGTALEISDRDGRELFHVVLDGRGRRQVLLLASQEHVRIPLDVMEKILASARELVTPAP
jgi:hypothetical protein